MFHGIKNILIILLIGILASGMPIYAGNINLGTLLPDITPAKDVVSVTAEQNIISSNHVQVTFGFSPKSKTSHFNFSFDKSKPFTIELSSNDEQVPNLSSDTLISSGGYKDMEFHNNDAQYITFEFEQEKLDLPDGSYNLKIMPNIKDKEMEITDCEFNIDFSTKGNYIQAISAVKDREMALTLYFPDNEFNHLIPITRIVKFNTYPLTTIIRNIEQGPDNSLGLPTISPIPAGGSAGQVGDTAHVKLPRDIEEFGYGSTKATVAIDSFVKSLTSMKGISKVQFRLTGGHLNDPFHGMDMSKPFFPPKNTEIYTAYITDTDRFLLQPIPFDMFDGRYDKNNSIEAIFDAMKFKAMPGIYNAKRHPLVPDNVKLLDYNINNETLTLIFNEGFIKTYEDNQDRHKMMVDGIVFTFMSLENVGSVNIKIKPDSVNSGSTKLINYDFIMPVYINPENR